MIDEFKKECKIDENNLKGSFNQIDSLIIQLSTFSIDSVDFYRLILWIVFIFDD